MDRTPSNIANTISEIDARDVKDICARFETAWGQETCNRPRIEDYLANVNAPVRAILVPKLVVLDANCRRKRGGKVLAHEYLDRFPDLDQAVMKLLSDAIAQNLETVDRVRPDTAVDCSSPATNRFDDYDILDEIARGAMGVVFRARQISLRREVALKMILAGQLASPAQVERFQREARAAAALDHPGIVPIYEIGERDGQHYFSMKLIEGSDLGQRLGEFRSNFEAIARLLVSVADAVHHAHERGLLHRDLKPGNILLDAQKQPHVTDFGLARQIEEDSKLTQSDVAVGTPIYMSPEQALGMNRTLTAATDVYALGAILYHLLTGMPPFKGDNAFKILEQVIRDDPPAPRQVNRAVPRDLETICLTCLRKEPTRRYASAAGFADDLNRWLNNVPIKTRRTSTLERMWRWSRRHPVAASLTLAFFLAPFVAFAVVRQFDERQNQNYAAALVDAVVTADIETVAARIDELNGYRQWANPRLVQEYENASDSSPEKLRASLALLPTDAGQIDYLYSRLMDLKLTSNPSDVRVICEALRPHKDALLPKLWAVAANSDNENRSQRKRAAVALAQYDPENAKWSTVQRSAAHGLLAVPEIQLPKWQELLFPVRHRLIDPLMEVAQNSLRPGHDKARAKDILLDFIGDEPTKLADLLMIADEHLFESVFTRANKYPRSLIPKLQDELSKVLDPVPLAWKITFYKWGKKGDQNPPSMEHVLKQPAIDEMTAPRLWFDMIAPGDQGLTKKVPREYFAGIATASVSLGEGDYVMRMRFDDAIRVWLDDVMIFESWQGNYPATESVLIRNRPGPRTIKIEFAQVQHGYLLGAEVLRIASAKHQRGQHSVLEERRIRDEAQTKRQANAAIALFRMGMPDDVFHLLKHTPDPTFRSFLIHRLLPFGADMDAIAKRLESESDPTVRRALILILGQLHASASTETRKSGLEKVRILFKTDPDPGVHSASEWLLRNWNDSKTIDEEIAEWSRDEKRRDERFEGIRRLIANSNDAVPPLWYVDGLGQTMVVIPGPIEFVMGSPDSELGRHASFDESQHPRLINRTFAIATIPFTSGQHRKLLKLPLPKGKEYREPRPANSISWYQAAKYCNQLSKAENIPKDQWCFKEDEKGEVIALSPSYLQLTGYRFPTESEWEFATRAGSTTVYHWGDADELAGHYSRFEGNAQRLLWAAGSRMPNDWGFFDMPGNSYTWCMNVCLPYADDKNVKGKYIDSDSQVDISNNLQRALRGGSGINDIFRLRSASRWGDPPASTYVNIGFRVARTLPFSTKR